ncbi:hypothetical protein [Hydrogenivirga sp.]
MVKRLSREDREQTVLRIVRILAQRGYRFSTYRNLANAVFEEGLFNNIYIGWCPSLIRKALIKHQEEIRRIFRIEQKCSAGG